MQAVSRFSHIFLTLSAALVMSACVSRPVPTQEARIWRMAVADATTPNVRIWDVEEREEVAVLMSHSPTRLRDGPGEMVLAAVQGKSGQVQLLHIGLEREDHGDHQHWVTGKPKLSVPVSSGQKPSHANYGEGKLAVFYDAEGLARIYNPAAPGETLVINANAPHHGLVVPLPRNRFLVSVAANEGSLPHATQVVDASGHLLQRSPVCERQHGDAVYGTWHLFGCANGLLTWNDAAQEGKSGFALQPYPQGSATRMVRTLLQARDSGRFVGNFGADGLLFVTLAQQNAAPRLASMTLPARLMHFAWDSQHSHMTYALLDTGALLAIDSGTQQVVQQTQAIPAWKEDETDEAKRLPKPQVAVAEGRIVVSDPRTGLVHVLHTKDLRESDQLKVGGTPSSLILRSVDLGVD